MIKGKRFFALVFFVTIPIFFIFTGASLFDKQQFVTLSSTQQSFAVHGKVSSVRNYTDISAAPLTIKESANWSIITFNKSGYYGLNIDDNGIKIFYSVFVSPVPSVHADKHVEQINWYQSQFNSGTTSNCGPASCAMTISWAQEEYYPTSLVRKEIGWHGDGATSFEELIKVVQSKGVNAKILPLRTFDDIKNIIDSGSVAVVLFKTDGVSSNVKDPQSNFFNKHYVDNVGHYIVVKGYSKDGMYVIVHDPIPSDWTQNKFRHNDGISMLGQNRYFNASELLKSLRRADMLVVTRRL
ncbi:MAG: hypothetical protein Ta2F_01820 [Termitinemataceae bacterium]|nr:MAG: hypothetical protein Ta2F_01820 [Termitinemataceae bacterium]